MWMLPEYGPADDGLACIRIISKVAAMVVEKSLTTLPAYTLFS
jgi:hypothetical protein